METWAYKFRSTLVCPMINDAGVANIISAVGIWFKNHLIAYAHYIKEVMAYYYEPDMRKHDQCF